MGRISWLVEIFNFTSRAVAEGFDAGIDKAIVLWFILEYIDRAMQGTPIYSLGYSKMFRKVLLMN